MINSTEVPLEMSGIKPPRMKSGDGKPVPGTGKIRLGGRHGTGSRTDKKK